MSVKKELTFLREKAKSLEKQLLEVDVTLQQLKKRRDEVKRQKEEYSMRTSKLAKRLLEKTQMEIEDYEKQIEIVESQIEKLEKSFEKTMNDIRSLEDGLARYVLEQVERMVHETLDYIKAHYEEIGAKIKEEFRITCENKKEKGIYSYYCVPTGNIEIIAYYYSPYDSQPIERISKTEDYCFAQNLYDTYLSVYKEVNAQYTDWFNEYFAMFKRYFLKKLQDAYNFADFELTVTDSGFILELV